MLSDVPIEAPPRAPAKARILDVVTVLFYSEGIRAVGVDRIISEASVTKATFYKHYRAKDNLIVEYISERHRAVRSSVEGLISESENDQAALDAFVAAIIEEINSPNFRGCPFINAAAEFADPEHPVRVVVTAHREWYVDTLAMLLKGIGHPLPGNAADELLLARDGALSGGYAGDSVAAIAALGGISRRIFAEAA